MLGKPQPRLRQREPEGLVALVRCRLRHSQAVLRVAAVDVVGTHVYAPRYAFGRNATSQPGQTRDPSNVSGRKSVLQCRIGDIDMGGGGIPRKRKRAPLRARQVLPCLRALAAQDGTSIAKQAG